MGWAYVVWEKNAVMRITATTGRGVSGGVVIGGGPGCGRCS